ncbi:MAG: FtsX-like permease family protein [Candidatus Omnitrophota bacterium]
MNLFSVSLKNLTRKKIRTALTIGGVGIAIAVLVSLWGFDTGYQRSLNNDIDKMGYQILVTAKGCPYEAATLMLQGGGGLRYMDESVYKKIIADPRVDKITPELVATAYDTGKEAGRGGISLYMGVDNAYLALKPLAKFKAGGWFSGRDAGEAVMGYEVAEYEQRSVGDKIFIPGRNEVLTVVGIFQRNGTQDDGIIFLPLVSAQKIFEVPGKLTGIGIKLKDMGQLSKFEEDLYNEPGIQIISLAQVKGTILNLVSSAKAMTNSVALIAIIIAVIGVVNTILMSVFERTSEIGVMKAIGASRFDIFRIIWIETTLICIFGGILGNLTALAGGAAIEHILKQVLPYAPKGHLVIITAQTLCFSFFGAVLMGLLAGIYPAFRASSMKPIEAIRRGE